MRRGYKAGPIVVTELNIPFIYCSAEVGKFNLKILSLKLLIEPER